MSPPLLKVCGLARSEDARMAVDAGSDLCGVVFAPGSPRRATIEDAQAIVAQVGGDRVVGVFRAQPLDEVIATCRALALRTVQLHGGYAADDAAQLQALGLRVIFAVPVEVSGALGTDASDATSSGRVDAIAADWLLLDTARGGVCGGVGVPFRWDAAARPTRPFFVAGGLSPENLHEAIAALRPHGVDLSSSLESAPGHKCPQRMAALAAAWRRVTEGSNV
jgi:phosphoribosylanthranilate isomerase